MELNKELFRDCIAFRFSEVGAMGPAGTLECPKANGESFVLNYMSEETPWENIKECFPGINGCIFNGPTKRENLFSRLIVIGGDDNNLETRVNSGWRQYRHLREGYMHLSKEF